MSGLVDIGGAWVNPHGIGAVLPSQHKPEEFPCQVLGIGGWQLFGTRPYEDVRREIQEALSVELPAVLEYVPVVPVGGDQPDL